MTESGVIAGKLTDPGGLPIAGCLIDVLMKLPASKNRSSLLPGQPFRIGEIMTLDQIHTQDNGEFRIGSLRPRDYYLRAWGNCGPPRPANKYRDTFYPHALNFTSAKPIVVAPGQQVSADIQISAQLGVRIAGRLLLPPSAGEAANTSLRTTIFMVPDEILNSSNRSAQAKNVYELTDVLPGKYLLMAVTGDEATNSFDAPKPILR